ncbi:MAG TPA: UDP-N-acetylmuramoyl-L-alanyl-D-glutamate--2,6-diaminopimelate ligase, partial [Chloroflexi bacterium]|nr:UDP-N-acetylmuramoyl-L-alanyl-D-glutamate--2,6-diaminopimelate ligase [Chloroflexota bacterium]
MLIHLPGRIIVGNIMLEDSLTMPNNHMKHLKRLTAALPTVLDQIGDDVDVRAITVDSRRAQVGDLFVAIPGVNVDGHRFIPQAVAAGARIVVGEREAAELPLHPGGAFTYVRVPNAREAWAWLCAAWHDFPSRQMTLIGVTGTDGKTSTVNLIYHILQAAGFETGMVSTVNARIGDEERDTGLHTTTPDPPDVQAYLARMVEAGATHAVLEVTSHGLAQHRVTGCAFDVAVVTNVTHEHLDAHGSLQAYQQAKARLFHSLSETYRKPDTPKIAILNRDDDSYRYLRPIPADRHITYGQVSPADVTAHDVRFAPDRTHLTIQSAMGYAAIETPLLGAFNVSNILVAFSTGLALGIPTPTIAQGISALRGIPGRMERIEAGQDFLAIVDFAHTPNALKRALETSRVMAGEKGRVIVVFGCAGLRDREKRAMMGHVAGQLADVVIVTAEDPRIESLEAIMAESTAAAQAEGKREGEHLWRVPDRGQAILKACQIARSGDVVIACGKGHEQSMC